MAEARDRCLRKLATSTSQVVCGWNTGTAAVVVADARLKLVERMIGTCFAR